MTFRVVRKDDIERFPARDDHHGVNPGRYFDGQGGDENYSVVISEYEPGGHVDATPQPRETTYVILTGALTMVSDGEEVVLHPLDAIHFTEGSVRAVRNDGDVPATMLVVRATS